MSFSTPLSAESITASLNALVARASQTPRDWPTLYQSFDQVEMSVRSEGSRRRYRWTQDTRNVEAEAAVSAFREELLPAFEAGASAFSALLLADQERETLGDAYSPQLLRLLKVEHAGLDPLNADLRLQERGLASAYDKHVASGTVDLGGQQLSLAQARSKSASADATLRKEAWLAWRGWFVEHRGQLSETFDELVAARQKMAERIGDSNFVPLGYAGMARTDFGPVESRAFRDGVEAHAVPLLRRLRAAQAKAHGTDTLRPWDVAYHPALSLPDGAASPIDSQLDKAEVAFSALSPRLVERLRYMRDNDLIDLENRPGKAAGAYCTAFHDESKVAIFCNSTGDEGDIRTLTHEMGHAFQCWESQWIAPVKLRWPTMDAAEIHSMGLEYLTLPHIGAFFGAEDADKFALGRWRRGVELLCYVACVDAFQHWVYENPGASVGERDAQWIVLQTRFDAGVDWSGEGAAFEASRWYAQLHIFRYPFYYIDYALAELGAMQLALAASQNQEAALNTYMDLCRLGGTRSMLELVSEVGLDSPFDDSVLARLMNHAGEILSPAL